MDKQHVLMIDDDRYSLSVLHQLVSELGYKTLFASTSDAARNMLASNSIKVIVFNQDLEATWGVSSRDLLRGNENNADTPVILISQASARYSPRVESSEDDTICFQKPIAIEPFVEYFRILTENPSSSPSKS